MGGTGFLIAAEVSAAMASALTSVGKPGLAAVLGALSAAVTATAFVSKLVTSCQYCCYCELVDRTPSLNRGTRSDCTRRRDAARSVEFCVARLNRAFSRFYDAAGQFVVWWQDCLSRTDQFRRGISRPPEPGERADTLEYTVHQLLTLSGMMGRYTDLVNQNCPSTSSVELRLTARFALVSLLNERDL